MEVTSSYENFKIFVIPAIAFPWTAAVSILASRIWVALGAILSVPTYFAAAPEQNNYNQIRYIYINHPKIRYDGEF